MLPLLFAILAMLVGAGLGLMGLAAPGAASRLVRLGESAPGGRAEFRATYGGVFFGLHAAGLACVAFAGPASDWATAACIVLAAGWAGSAIGRTVSMALDAGANTAFNRLSALFELAIALALAAPLIAG
jgi:Domain of unknown function (DUF4345)